MAKILVAEGSKDVLLGTPVAIIVNKKEDIAAFANYTSGSFVAAAADKAAPIAEETKNVTKITETE